MPLKKYGVLKGRPVKMKNSPDGAHLEIQIKADGKDYRIALNVRSQAVPPELRYLIHKDFLHPFVNPLQELKEGITSKADIALDYIRSNVFNYRKMKLAKEIAEGDNELSDTVELYVERAIREKDAMIYAFGEYWGPEEKEDIYFGFNPGQGIHDIHMNQGNAGRWARDNGTYQDGGMLIHFPDEDQWSAFFFAFQSQSFHTDESGNVFAVEADDENAVVIVGALLNPEEGAPYISLLNRTNRIMDMSGWRLAGVRNEKPIALSGELTPGEYYKVEVPPGTIHMQNTGGTIALIDSEGIKIHGASYTTPDYGKKGYLKVF